MDDFAVGIARCNEPHEILIETLDAIASSSCRPERVVVVDNGDVPLADDIARRVSTVWRPGQNIGCAGAWNMIYKIAAHPRTVILNADCAVVPDTFYRMLAEPPPTVVLAYAFGCFLIDEEIRRKVGPFDEEFWPVYFEDTDYRRRMKLAGIIPDEWPTTPAEVIVPGRDRAPTGIVHGSYDPGGYQGWRDDKLRWFWERYEANKARYAAKWGGKPDEETFETPFGKDAT